MWRSGPCRVAAGAASFFLGAAPAAVEGGHGRPSGSRRACRCCRSGCGGSSANGFARARRRRPFSTGCCSSDGRTSLTSGSRDPVARCRGRAGAAAGRRSRRSRGATPAYPPALAAIIDPPPVLWMRGVAGALERPAVAIVGSRAGRRTRSRSPSGSPPTWRARHRDRQRPGARRRFGGASRRAGGGRGRPIAVLGSGVDVDLSGGAHALAREIEASGALIVSELVPGTPPHPQFFPLRNRIISGLSRAVVVIEAGEKSGSLITARCALEQGPRRAGRAGQRAERTQPRRPRAVAGRCKDCGDRGRYLGGAGDAPASRRADAGGRTGGAGDPVLACLPPGEPCDLDAIAERSGLTPARLLPRLFELELQGLVRRAGGGRFVRV